MSSPLRRVGALGSELLAFMALGLAIPLGVLLVGIPIALGVRFLLWVVGAL